MEKNKIRHYIAVFGIFFIFLIFGIWEIIKPQYWVGFVPGFISNSFNPTTLVVIHGILLSLVGLWIISGFYLRIAAIFSTIILADIVLSLLISSGFSDLLVRDIVIMLFSFSLVFDEK